VYDVAGPDEAVRIAISKTGEMLNPDLSYVEIEMGERACPDCEAELSPAFVAADEALVALELTMDVFNVEREEHAARIARTEIGGQMENVPLEVLEIEPDPDEDAADEERDGTADEERDGTADEERDGTADTGSETTGDGNAATAGGDDGDAGEDQSDRAGTGEEGDEDQVLPEFDDLLEDG